MLIHLTKLELCASLDTRKYVAPRSLSFLARMKGLQELTLAHFFVDDDELEPAAGLSALQAVDLSDCELRSAACLLPLEHLGLKVLYLAPDYDRTWKGPAELPPGLRFPWLRGHRVEFMP